jgi:nucleoside-diphosphate-sugar epimerase
MKKALVTGGCGFIGSNLVKALVEKGWQVDIVDDMSGGHLELLDGLQTRTLMNGSFYTAYTMQDLKRSQAEVLIIQDDFSDDNVLNAVYQGVYDVIFHQAAIPRVSYSVEQPWHTTDTNISKTVRLFEAARGSVDRIVWASSSSVYGGADLLPTPESSPKNPKSPYAWQKSTIEDFAKICWDLYKLDVVCLRYFNVFGPGQYGDSPYSTAISAWCHSIKNGLECRSDGDGEQSRDMCYIDNVIHANILAANLSSPLKGECFNVACGDKVTNNEILQYLKKKFGPKVKVLNAPTRAGDVRHTQADVGKIKKQLGYEPLVRFWEGLSKTTAWWDLKEK